MSSYLPPEVEFENVFNLHRLNHLLNLSFHEIKSEMPSLKAQVHYLAEKYLTFSE